MWYLIVSIPDLCTLTYFATSVPFVIHSFAVSKWYNVTCYDVYSTHTFENKHIINITKKTDDSKIDEIRRKKYEIIQVMGDLYRYISLTSSNCSNTFTVIYLFQRKIVYCTFKDR